MSGAVLDESDEAFGGLALRGRGGRVAFGESGVVGEGAIHELANEANDVDIRPFVVAANVVDLAEHTFLQNQLNAARVIGDEQPIADVFAVAVDWQRQAVQDVGDAQRNEFFREMIRPVVVGAVAGGDVQAVGVMVGAYQMIGGRLAGRIGRVGGVRCGLGECGVASFE